MSDLDADIKAHAQAESIEQMRIRAEMERDQAEPKPIPPTDPGCDGTRISTDEAGNPIMMPEHVTPDELAFLVRFFIGQVDRIEGRVLAIAKALKLDIIYDEKPDIDPNDPRLQNAGPGRPSD